MTVLYVLDVPENTAVAKVAAADPEVTVDRIGPYFELRSERDIVIDRRATGCRHAVWYSCIAGVPADSRVVQHDKDALRVTPA
ncbi:MULTISPECIES: hypothetical protein [Pseudonocardia]|uniref:Uncharacterized protein n=2 Tax=Pseudonocardia TaxID=1847 RepID=A0A1Y2MJR0_PSEAH|nr:MULTISPECIES: hypothetical protein [Pseudonocardia]OSY35480.1 hypothetical protein BG845_06018 [Pseudonocardia autotrophica]TDN76956.1 hypothetical protein C8E95_6176 [Pseudonocardia autotrophica]BBG00960.1 hypothetical protein Pdca_21690 [Pseudonocardia autotrophica]GEC29163.1 hypothetical protein PSA01_61920 [Pseudonocardia saturnea]